MNLFEKYGGFSTLHKVVSAFYDKILEEEKLRLFFDDVNMAALVDHQTQFIASVMGGPVSFDDERLLMAHKGLGLGEQEWAAVVDILIVTLETFEIEGRDIETIVKVLATKKPLIIGDEDPGAKV